jgi:Ras GTPase-activating-like protein IQGAP2/3
MFPLIHNMRHSHCLQATGRDDPLYTILTELEGVPNFGDEGSYELHDARDRAITLELTNRFAVVRG